MSTSHHKKNLPIATERIEPSPQLTISILQPPIPLSLSRPHAVVEGWHHSVLKLHIRTIASMEASDEILLSIRTRRLTTARLGSTGLLLVYLPVMRLPAGNTCHCLPRLMPGSPVSDTSGTSSLPSNSTTQAVETHTTSGVKHVRVVWLRLVYREPRKMDDLHGSFCNALGEYDP